MPLTLQQKLDQAEDAYHKLMIGGNARVFVDQNGERIEYSAANAQKLLQYINWLRDMLGLQPYAPTVKGPLNPFF